jgi:hypothetical protein
MANRFIGGVLSSRPQANTPFVSRASTGTYFDSAGVMRTAPINQPRLNYNLVGSAWTQPSVLLEPETTNIVSYSQDFSQASYWGPNNSTIGTAAGTAPDGTNTAFKIQENTSSNLHGVEQQLGSTNGQAYTLSIFAKAAERSWLIVDNTHQGVANYRNWFNLSTGVVGTMNGSNSHLTIVPVGNGWYRCSVTRPAGTLGTHRICIYASTGDGTTTYTGTSGSGILIWGCQLEYKLGMTSYISSPSTGVGTRAADVVGPYSSGIYSLEDRQNTTANDDQFTVQSFTTTGSTTWTAPLDVNSVEVLVVAGGGAGGSSHGGGGGGGEVLYNPSYPVVAGATYPIIVGTGGTKQTWGVANSFADGGPGNTSSFATLIAKGGQGGKYNGPGGASGNGYPGGDHLGLGNNAAGGGAGAGGFAIPATAAVCGGGGPGLNFNISGTATYYGGGGGATGYPNQNAGLGGAGGGGTGQGVNGSANTGGGGAPFANGGSGIVIVKYKRTPRQISSVSNAAIVTQKFIVSNTWTAPAGVTSVEVLVVAGGGGGGRVIAGGGGAGGLVYNSAFSVTPGSTYTVTVGEGGAGQASARTNGANGSNSVFGSLTAIGGGGGAGYTSGVGSNGGSGGGSKTDAGGTIRTTGGSSTQNSSGSTGYGNAGGGGQPTATDGCSGGGGGAGSAGGRASGTSNATGPAGNGGSGLPFSLIGTTEYYAGGGGGGARTDTATILAGPGGIGGGGAGGNSGAGLPGAPNTGGGGGGGGFNGSDQSGGNGGSGVVVLRYRVPQIATFLDSGSWTCPSGVTSVQALVVAGGGGGTFAGGGAGGLIYSTSVSVTPGVTYPVVVGQGSLGNFAGSVRGNGTNSSFNGLIAVGGGEGSQEGITTGASGGSGGGGNATGGSGTYGQGNNGGGSTYDDGTGCSASGGGGGGAGGAGGAGTYNVRGGNGGAGLQFSISGTTAWYAVGGAGEANMDCGYLGGTAATNGSGAQTNGAQNTGNGGGSRRPGGSGIVILRWSGA